MNIDTDTQWATWAGVKDYYLANERYLQGQIGNTDGDEKPITTSARHHLANNASFLANLLVRNLMQVGPIASLIKRLKGRYEQYKLVCSE